MRTSLMCRSQVCWPTLEMVREACVNTKAKGFGFPEAIATALCEVYTAASRSGRSALGASVGQILSAIKGILATEFHGDSARSALLAFATIVEVFGNTKAAQHECCQLLAGVSASVGAWLLVPGQIDEAQELAVSYLDLLYRSAIFCPQLIFSDPSIVKGALELLALSLRHSVSPLSSLWLILCNHLHSLAVLISGARAASNCLLCPRASRLPPPVAAAGTSSGHARAAAPLRASYRDFIGRSVRNLTACR